jgi:hypothetical protein
MAIDSGIWYGSPRIKVLTTTDPNSTVIKTLYLPVPRSDGIDFGDSPARGIEKNMLNGKRRMLTGGYVRRLTISWSHYNPLTTGKVIGTGDGQTPLLGDLYDIISLNQGKILVSPGSNSEVWFRAYVVSELTRNPLGKLLFRDVQIEFKGCDPFVSVGSSTIIT